MNEESKAEHQTRRKLSVSEKLLVFASSLVLMALLGLPHALLPVAAASAAGIALSLLLTGILLIATRQGKGRPAERVVIGVRVVMATSVFLACVLTSASIGVFFHLPLKPALIAFLAISIGGAVAHLSILAFLVLRVYPHLLNDRES